MTLLHIQSVGWVAELNFQVNEPSAALYCITLSVKREKQNKALHS